MLDIAFFTMAGGLVFLELRQQGVILFSASSSKTSFLKGVPRVGLEITIWNIIELIGIKKTEILDMLDIAFFTLAIGLVFSELRQQGIILFSASPSKTSFPKGVPRVSLEI